MNYFRDFFLLTCVILVAPPLAFAQDVPIREFDHKGTTRAVAISSDGKYLASAGDGSLRLWNLPTGKNIASWTDTGRNTNWLGFSPDGKSLASGTEYGEVRLWEIPAGTFRVLDSGEKTSIVQGIAFSSDGKTLAVATPRWRLRLFDVQTGKDTQKSLNQNLPAFALAFSPDGTILASNHMGIKNPIILWDTTTFKQKKNGFHRHGRGDRSGISPQWQDVGHRHLLERFP